MGPIRLVIFSIVIGVLLFLIDFYVLKKWRLHVKKFSLNKLWFRIPLIFAIVMATVYLFVSWYRIGNPEQSRLLYFLYLLIGFWYTPKILIALVLLFGSIFIFLKRMVLKNIPSGRKNAVKKELINSRRKFLANAGWSLAAAPFMIYINGASRTTYNFKVHSHFIPLLNLHPSFDGLKIVQISDIHAGSFPGYEPFNEARLIIESLKPDILVITGDFVNYNPDELNTIIDEMTKLRADMGVYACLGNHDHYMTDESHSKLLGIMNDLPLNLLNNSNTTIEKGQAKLQLAGIDNISLRQDYGDLKKATENLSPQWPTILLSHDPTNWDRFVRKKMNVDLMLSGHTHGGQVGIDFWGTEISPAQIVYKQWAGPYTYKDQHLYINRGLSTVGPPIRIGIKPEITLLTLKSAPRYT